MATLEWLEVEFPNVPGDRETACGRGRVELTGCHGRWVGVANGRTLCGAREGVRYFKLEETAKKAVEDVLRLWGTRRD